MAAIPFPVLSWWSRTYNCVSDFVIRYRFEKSCLAMCYHNCIERLFLINDLDIVAAKKNYVTLFSLTKNRSFDSKSKHLKCRCFKLSQISLFHFESLEMIKLIHEKMFVPFMNCRVKDTLCRNCFTITLPTIFLHKGTSYFIDDWLILFSTVSFWTLRYNHSNQPTTGFETFFPMYIDRTSF